MSREQKTAVFFFSCIAWFAIVYAAAGMFVPAHRFTVALMAAALLWAIGFSALNMVSAWRGRREVVDDERDRRLSWQATFIGGAAGYLALFFGITAIHAMYAMNGRFTLPIDTLYILFALVLLTFGTVRELAVLALYRLGDTF